MVSYQLLVFGIGLVVLGIAFTALNDQFYELTSSGMMGYNGSDPTFQFGQTWMDFLWGLIPTLIFISGGVWCAARAMKG